MINRWLKNSMVVVALLMGFTFCVAGAAFCIGSWPTRVYEKYGYTFTNTDAGMVMKGCFCVLGILFSVLIMIVITRMTLDEMRKGE